MLQACLQSRVRSFFTPFEPLIPIAVYTYVPQITETKNVNLRPVARLLGKASTPTVAVIQVSKFWHQCKEDQTE